MRHAGVAVLGIREGIFNPGDRSLHSSRQYGSDEQLGSMGEILDIPSTNRLSVSDGALERDYAKGLGGWLC